MGSEVKCDSGHAYLGPCRKAAREFNEHGTLLPCSRCGKDMHYLVAHTYPFHKVTVKYEVIRVLTLFSANKAELEGYDPMVFLMKNLGSGKQTVWPYYWTKNRRGKWANGQFPHLFRSRISKR